MMHMKSFWVILVVLAAVALATPKVYAQGGVNYCGVTCSAPVEQKEMIIRIKIPGCDELHIVATFSIQKCDDTVNIWMNGFKLPDPSLGPLNSPECDDAYREFIQPGGGRMNFPNYNKLLAVLADRVSMALFEENRINYDANKYRCPDGMVTHNFIRSLCTRKDARMEFVNGQLKPVEVKEIECSEDCCIQRRTLCFLDISVDGKEGPIVSVTDTEPVPTKLAGACSNKTPPDAGFTTISNCESGCRKIIVWDGRPILSDK